MNATCPTCGLAVVPGYVRCPKCQRPLPVRRSITVAGGTAVSGGGLPIIPIVGVGVVVLGIILYFALSRGDAPVKPAEPVTPTDDQTDDTTPSPQTNNPVPIPNEPSDPNRVDPDATAKDLERALRRQRLWSSVEVVGRDVEVRSGSCRDEQMIPMVDAARTALHNAGLTRLRCLEQSGAVVFEREL